jgi:cephalosporin-C deacetylase-like acetyl esterase
MKRMRFQSAGLVLICIIACVASATLAEDVRVTPLRANGVYHAGEKIQWAIELKTPDAASVKQAEFVLKAGQMTVMKKGTVDVTDGKCVIETQLDQPGTVLGEIHFKSAGKPVSALFGAVADPEKIKPSAPPPEDFDSFWKSKLAELEQVPVNAKIEPADGGKPNVEYFKVQMDNIRGTHIYGQLARPKAEGKFPALLLVQYAGVYGLPKTNVVNRAAQGWLALNIMAHDLPFDQPEEFYKKATETTLKDYISIGAADRDTSYFLRMYLACYRAADYLSQRPDWDGKTLVVMGTSQGGQQSLITAGFYPGITAMIANVPAGCDVTGPNVGRSAGFPYWANTAKSKHNDKVLETGRYYDAVNFAAHIHCPALVATGLIDTSCPAAGVLTAVNQMTGPKEVVIMVNSDHHGHGNAQAQFYKRSEAWLAALVKGESAPVQ